MARNKLFSASNQGLESYIENTFGGEDEVLKSIRLSAEQAGLPAIHVAPSDGKILQLLARLTRARKVVEIGTLAGYSTVWLARGLEPGGRIWTFERDEKHAAVARANFKEAGLSEIVQLVEGDALHNLLNFEEAECDLVFIDANKTGYEAYFDWAKTRVRIGGLIVADNTLAWGQIHNAQTEDRNVQALQRYNSGVGKDPHFSSLLIPTGEGMTVALRLE